MSAEQRARVRVAQVGHPVSEATRAKMRVANLGHVTSKETRAKLRVANLGLHHSAETRTKMSLAQLGEKNHRWMGEFKAPSGGYEKIYIHPQFYIFVHRVNMERTLGRRLRKGEVVHHINKEKLDNGLGNLALCSNQAAHRWAHTEEARIFFGT